MDAVTGHGSERRPGVAIVCALLGHRPDGPPVWNEGHGFARCTRCDRAIVRTIVHGWRLPPRGYRIRWPATDAAPAEQTGPAPASRPATRSPVATSDFMRDPRAGTTSSAFDFDDFAAGSANPPRRRRSLS